MRPLYVVVPTYNERESLPELVEKIFAQGVPLKLFIADDSSPDGTAEVVKELSKRYPIALLSQTEKGGLGKAYCNAFAFILNELKGEPATILHMDADLSHDPSATPALLAALDTADVVIGSRYILLGNTLGWSRTRQIISKAGNTYARTVLGLPYKDVTSGFRAYKSELLAKLLTPPPAALSYNFLIEMTYRAHKQRAKIQEIPITFTERRQGKSKFNFLLILESFWSVLRLRFKSQK